jgi:hypothetical protein
MMVSAVSVGYTERSPLPPPYTPEAVVLIDAIVSMVLDWQQQ